MAFELQELSTSSSASEGELDLEVPDTEIARALSQPVGSVSSRPGRGGRALRIFGTLLVVVGVIAALGFMFYGEREHTLEETRLADELQRVEAFVQYDVLLAGEEDPATLKTTDPPPM